MADPPDAALESAKPELTSRFRIRAAFTLFTVAVVAALTILMFVLVSHIFSRLNPAIEADLEWKARRGAVELAALSDVGILLEDAASIRKVFAPYASGSDVMAIVATDVEGKVVASHGTAPVPPAELFSGPPRSIKKSETAYVSWTEVQIEGALVGRVAVVASTARLRAGSKLKHSILFGASVGAVVAFLLALGFVNFYIDPVLRLTSSAFQRLEKTTALALEATRLKSEFLANMSHEIRTPMNGLLGMIELLRDTGLDARQRRYGETLQLSANGLMTVLNDILDFSKMEAGKLELHPEPTSVREALEEVAELFAARAHIKGLELACHTERSLPLCVEADRNRLKQVLSNLVGNALKFTERGQVVLSARLEAHEGSPRVRLEVTDTGIGIPLPVQGSLFEAFSQVDGSLTRKHGGTGLGLAICKQLVTLMGGTIEVQSSPGAGSTFSVSLPLIEAPARGAAPEVAGTRVHTLIVDDNAANRFVLEELLTGWGFAHASAGSADGALQAMARARAASNAFGLVITDMDMPELDGVTLARRVQSAGPHLPVILLTSPSEGLSTDARKFVDACVQKPVRAAELAQAITRALNSRPSERKTSAALSPAPPREQRHLLVVEDNAINQLVMTEILEALGYSADIAENGQEALNLLALRDYPLVFMDCQMPVLDGYRTASEIRKRETEKGGRRLPLIAITAHALAEERSKVLAAGMDDYLSKPVSKTMIVEMLERWWPCADRSERLIGVAAKVASGAEERIIAGREPLGGRSSPHGELAARLEQNPLYRGKLHADLEIEHVRRRFSPRS